MATLPGLVVNLTLQQAQFTAGINQANAQLGTLNKAVSTAGAAIKSMAIGFGSAFAIQGIVSATRATFAWADALEEASQRVGITVEQMQQLQNAAEKTSVSQSQVTGNLEKFARGLGDAASGTGTLKSALERTGIELRNQDGSLRSVSAVFEEYATAIANAGTEQEAISLAVAAFGRGGAGFVTTLREMASGLDEVSVLTAEQVTALAKYDDKISQLGQHLEFFAKSLLASVVTELEQVGRGFNVVTRSVAEFLDSFVGTSFAEALASESRQAAEAMADFETAVARAGQSAANAAPQVDELTDAIRKANSAAGERLGDVEFAAANLHVEEAKKEIEAFNKAQAEGARVAKQAADEARRLATTRQETLESLKIERAEKERLLSVSDKSERAFETMKIAIEGENAARRVGLDLSTEQGRAIATEAANIAELTIQIDANRASMERRNQELEEMNKREGDLRLLQQKSLARQDLGVPTPGPEDKAAIRTTEDAFSNMLESIQSEFTDTFAEMVKGGIRSFQDIADAATDIFANLSANLASLAIFDPTRFKQLAAQSGISPGLLGAGAFAPPLIGAGLGLAGANAAGQNFAMGSGLGAGAGALVGSFIPVVGTALGAVAGGVAGGALGAIFGGLFGGGPSGNQASIGGGFGRAGAGGTGEAAKFVVEFDKQMSKILNDRQLELADQALRAAKAVSVKYGEEGLSEGDMARLAAGRIAPVAGALGFRKQAFKGLSAEEGLAQLGEALQLEKTIQNLTSAVTPFKRAILDLRAQFAATEARAKELGISTRGMGAALRETEAQMRAQRDFERASLRLQLETIIAGTSSSKQLTVAIAAIRLQFDQLRESAEDLEIPLELVTRAEEEAVRQAREAASAVNKANRAAERAEQDARRQAERQRETERNQRARERAHEANERARDRAREANERARERAAEAKQYADDRKAARAFIKDYTTTSDFESQRNAINANFREALQLADKYNLSEKGIRETRTEQIRALKRQAAAEKESAQATISSLIAGDTFRSQLDAINAEFRNATDLARQYGLSEEGLTEARLEAIRTLKRQQQEQIDALALSVIEPFKELADPLHNFIEDLERSLLTPIELFKVAQEDFRETARRAQGGDVEAIQELEEASRFYIEQAGRFGASPEQVSAIREVMQATEGVTTQVDISMREASRGITDEIRKASNRQDDTLKELIETSKDMVRELKRLRT